MSTPYLKDDGWGSQQIWFYWHSRKQRRHYSERIGHGDHAVPQGRRMRKDDHSAIVKYYEKASKVSVFSIFEKAI